MAKIKKQRFELYRYQLRPARAPVQKGLFAQDLTNEELIEKKNEIFFECLQSFKNLMGARANVIVKPELLDNEFSLFKLAVNRSVVIETEDFKAKEIDDWPSFLVGFWNSPDKQYLIIQARNEAFQNTQTAMNAIKETLLQLLLERHLNIEVEPLFDRKGFWDIIAKYNGRVNEVKFDLVTPNMANISQKLTEDLKHVAKSTETVRTQLSLTAAPDSSLKLSQGDGVVDGLVDYSSQGGGNVSIKITGVKRRLQTNETKMSIEIAEAEINAPANQIVEIMKSLIE